MGIGLRKEKECCRRAVDVESVVEGWQHSDEVFDNGGWRREVGTSDE